MNISAARLHWLYLRGPVWWMGLTFTVVGVVLLFIVISIWQGEERFEANATRASATITGKDTRTEMRGPKGNTPTPVFVLHYAFKDAAGQSREGSSEVPNNDWTVVRTGDPLLIEYDRTDPSITRLPGRDRTTRWGLLAAGIGAGAFLTIGLAIVACLLIRSGQRARLIRTGTPALGVVDAVVENNSAVKLEGTYRVTYHFTDAQGTTREGRGPPQPGSLAGRFSAGDTVLVLYDASRPDRHEADLFEARSAQLAELQSQANNGGAD